MIAPVEPFTEFTTEVAIRRPEPLVARMEFPDTPVSVMFAAVMAPEEDILKRETPFAVEVT